MPYKDKQREKEYRRYYMRKYCQRPYVIERIKKYRENPEVKARRKEHAKEYKRRPEIKLRREENYKKNKRRILAIIKKNHEMPKVKARIKEYNKKYMKEYWKKPEGKLNRQKSKSKRRECTQNVITLWSKEEWKKKLKNSNGYCYGFNKQPHFIGISKLTLDHIHPLSRAKKDRIYTINDIQPLCPDCNSTKGIHI